MLQLELDDVRGLKVNDVIEQLEDSITEPALKELHFVGLVDRAGGRHKGESSLSKALGKRRNQTKDILVGLSKGGSIDEVFKRARPILGDPNVGRMVCFFFLVQKIYSFRSLCFHNSLFSLSLSLSSQTKTLVGNEWL